jgi:arylsulfatase A
MGQFRGLKRDVWEGGHHIPFIVKWPRQIRAGTVSDEVICQTDIMATLAEIVNIKLPKKAAPDSYNFLPVLKGEKYESPLREATIHNTSNKVWGIRKGDWLYINNHTGSGGRKAPDSFMELRGYTDFDTPGILFNMNEDPEQRVNLYNEYPEKMQELNRLIEVYKEQDYSVKDN